MDEPLTYNLTPAQRNEIRDLSKRVAAVFQVHGADAKTAFTVLLNVMGSLIGTQFNDLERVDYIYKAQAYLPMYVEAYRVKEKTLGG